MTVHKSKKNMDVTDSSKIYKRARKRHISNITGKCSFCGYHRGENSKRNSSRNWKSIRRTQHREERV